MKKLNWIIFSIINFIGLSGLAVFYLKIMNAFFILGVFLVLVDVLFIFVTEKFIRQNKNTEQELQETRNELTKTIEEMSIHSAELEDQTRKMKVLEQDLLDAQEELNEIVSELSIYTKQLEDILNNIDIGVCMITPDLKIESNFNNQFRTIFGNREYWEQSIVDSIFGSFDAKTKHEIQEYIEMIFSNTSVSIDMLNEANPMKEFSYILNQDGKVENKEISTTVVPIKNENDEVAKVMFLFKDTSYEKELSRALQSEKEEFESELKLITAIFHNDRGIVTNFLNDLPETKKLVSQIIDSVKMNFVNKDTIYRLVGLIHSLKGESLSLDFEDLGKFCQTFENYLKTIAEQEIDLTKNMELANYQATLNSEIDKVIDASKKIFQFSEDTEEFSTNKVTFDMSMYQSLLSELNSFVELYKNGSLTLDKVAAFQEKLHRFTWVPLTNIEKEMTLLSEKASAKLNKKVKLQFMFEIDSLPQNYFKLLKESFLHLIRNSIAHGIESHEERLAQNKPIEGRINIHITKEDDRLIVFYSDDGKGFDPEKIKKQAVENKLITSEQAEKMSNEEIIQLIFSDGFSTQKHADEISGTGVGMSVVKNNIVNFLHGKIILENKAPNGMGMKFSVPAPK